ncbi:MAG: hypothetical protein AMXMBFR59_41110 [Rhodanobacteraceae bacterium]
MTIVYCVDTSVVIDAGERHYPIDVFPAFWDRLDVLISAGRLKAPKTLIDELEQKDDAWRKWVYDRQTTMIWPIDGSIQSAVSNVMTVYASKVANVDSIKGDPFFIAASMAYGATLITSEQPKGGGIKIPNICNQMQVKWCSLLGMLRTEGWKF